MGLFDSLKNMASGIPGANEAMGKLSSVQQAVNPPELANMAQQVGVIKEKLAALEQAPQGPTTAADLVDLRISVMGHYIHCQEGGDPTPTDPLVKAKILAHPEFLALKAEYPALAQRLAALEKQGLQCTYGYLMADGTMYVPDLSWTPEQWQQIREQSVDKTARCWMDADRTQHA